MKTWMVMLGIIVVVAVYIGILLWDDARYEREQRKKGFR
jgi:hypothetical protein